MPLLGLNAEAILLYYSREPRLRQRPVVLALWASCQASDRRL